MLQTFYIVQYACSASIRSGVSVCVCVSTEERTEDMKLYAGFFKISGAGW